MPWEVKVISEDLKEAPIQIAWAESIVDVDKYVTGALESLWRACAAMNEDRPSNDRERVETVKERLALCGVITELVEVPAPEN